METHPGEEVMKEEKFQIPGNPLTGGSVGSFGNSEGNITRRGGGNKTKIMCLIAMPCK